MSGLIFIDQNAWIVLARGAWDKAAFPREHAALTKVVEGVLSGSIIAPLTFANIYETAKIGDPVRRANIARTQALISKGRVFRGRRQILGETLAAHIAARLSIPRPAPEEYWFLSYLWFEAAAGYSPDDRGFKISPEVLDTIRKEPERALVDYLLFNDDGARVKAVRRYSADSAELIARMEARRMIVAGETLPVRKRIYSARLVMDELDFILTTARQLGLNWRSIRDVGSSLTRSIPADVPVLNVERELAVRLEDQDRNIDENDLRDMASFTVTLPFADMIFAENQFVNLAIQARLHKTLRTKLRTSILDF